jgi:hypothetical protein
MPKNSQINEYIILSTTNSLHITPTSIHHQMPTPLNKSAPTDQTASREPTANSDLRHSHHTRQFNVRLHDFVTSAYLFVGITEGSEKSHFYGGNQHFHWHQAMREVYESILQNKT